MNVNLKFFILMIFFKNIQNSVYLQNKWHQQRGRQNVEEEEPIEEAEPQDYCNKRLLQNFNLNGLGVHQTGTDMTICKNIKSEDNCCSEIDEIKILKNWNEFSKPKLDKYIEDSMVGYIKIIEYHPFIS